MKPQRHLSDAEQKQVDHAMTYARANRKGIARLLTDSSTFPQEAQPVSVFMAGSPGAGKTEASIELINSYPEWPIVRIDPDELRNEFPDYEGSNAWLFQSAVARIVDAVLDRVYAQDQSFVLDGTLSSYEVARKNVQRSMKHDRLVQILYVYQEPILAWGFVQAREATEGRRIQPEDFVRQYFAARQVVNRLKKEFGVLIRVDLLMKNSDNSHRFYRAGVDLIDSYIPECVDQEALEFQLGVS